MKKILLILAFSIVLIIGYYFISTPSSYKIKNKNPKGKSIICFGDSLTYGTGAPKDMNYPAQLSKMINQPVINLGIPGETTSMALKRIDKVIELDPKIVLITLGGNDLKNGISKKVTFANLKNIITTIQNDNTLVIIGGIDIPFFGKGFGQAYAELARKTGSILVPNIYTGLLGNRDLMSDRIHPNSRGYTKLARKFYTVLKPYINQMHSK
ncbi:MAG TPA: arylesterase [Victivallales bacterium]|nr:arylesterase [Victivallales bacterium]